MPTPPVSTDSWESRREVRRADDGELLGFVVLGSDGAVPCTVFGSALGRAHADEETARSVVQAIGLDYLADRWLLQREAGDLQVRVVEASPLNVVVQNDDYGSGMDMNVRFALDAPASDRLRRG